MKKTDAMAKDTAEGFIEKLEELQYDGKDFYGRIKIDTDYFSGHHLNFTMDYDYETPEEQRFFAVNEDEIFQYLEKITDEEEIADDLDYLADKTSRSIAKHFGVAVKETNFVKDMDAEKILDRIKEGDRATTKYYELSYGKYDELNCPDDFYLRSLDTWHAGKLKGDEEITLPLKAYFGFEKKSSKLCDFPCGSGNPVYASKRGANFIRHLQKNMETLPCVIIKAGEIISEDFTVVLFPEYEAADMKASRYEIMDGGDFILYNFSEEVLDEKKLAKIPAEDNFFAMKEHTHSCICTEYAKDAIEKAFGRNAVQFYEVPVANAEYYRKLKEFDDNCVELISILSNKKKQLIKEMNKALEDVASYINTHKIVTKLSISREFEDVKDSSDDFRKLYKREVLAALLHDYKIPKDLEFPYSPYFRKPVLEYAGKHKMNTARISELLDSLEFEKKD